MDTNQPPQTALSPFLSAYTLYKKKKCTYTVPCSLHCVSIVSKRNSLYTLRCFHTYVVQIALPLAVMIIARAVFSLFCDITHHLHVGILARIAAPNPFIQVSSDAVTFMVT